MPPPISSPTTPMTRTVTSEGHRSRGGRLSAGTICWVARPRGQLDTQSGYLTGWTYDPDSNVTSESAAMPTRFTKVGRSPVRRQWRRRRGQARNMATTATATARPKARLSVELCADQREQRCASLGHQHRDDRVSLQRPWQGDQQDRGDREETRPITAMTGPKPHGGRDPHGDVVDASTAGGSRRPPGSTYTTRSAISRACSVKSGATNAPTRVTT